MAAIDYGVVTDTPTTITDYGATSDSISGSSDFGSVADSVSIPTGLTQFPFPPDQEGYGVTDGTAVVSTTLDGGSARYRQDLLNVAATVSVQWSFDTGKYQYWRAFYNTVINKGALPFALDLYMDQPLLTTHEVHIVPGSVKLSGQGGLRFTVQCTLEVIPLPVDSDFDTSLLLIYGLYGDCDVAFLNALNKLVNIDLPQINDTQLAIWLQSINVLINQTLPSPGYW